MAKGNASHKSFFLLIALSCSLATNIGLLSALWFQNRNAIPLVPQVIYQTTTKEQRNLLLLQQYLQSSFSELATLLSNTSFAEEGYMQRDLALAALVAGHHFDLYRALGGAPTQQRNLVVTKGSSSIPVLLFPGLTDEHFALIKQFIAREQLPFTDEGLFLQLQKKPADSLLNQGFLATRTFAAMQDLFQQSGASIDTPILIRLAKEGSWSLLEDLVKERQKLLNFSPERRRQLLFDFVALGSPTAALLLVHTDASFLLRRLDDKSLISLLSYVNPSDPQVSAFCIHLLESLRSDAVFIESARLLFRASAEPLPDPLTREVVLARFAPHAASSAPLAVKEKPTSSPPIAGPIPVVHSTNLNSKKTHTVQEGDTLWKIARKYQVNLADLMTKNQLDPKKTIRAGMELEIPSTP